jgi:VWFA-related protein
MFTHTHLGCFILASVFCAAATSAQQNSPPTEPANGTIHLDVVVTQKSGMPVAGLQQQDFTLLDNKAPQTITSFQAVGEREADQSVILVMDAVNTDYERLSYLRTEIGKFLRADGGHLAYPTALATFSDKGIQIAENFSTDGTALCASLDRANAGLRSSGLSRSTGFHGEAGRIQLSMQALDQLVASAAQVPGRKIVIWVSPGWPSMAEVQQGPTQQQQVFGTVVSISTELLQAHVTLYSVDPPGGDALTRDSFYKQFLKGVSKPNQAYAGNLALQVFAIQSGGLAYPASNDIASVLQECLKDTVPYYEISFDAPRTKRTNEYHRLEIELAKPGLIARTRQGYYAQSLPGD